MEIKLLLPEAAVEVWPLVKGSLQKALNHGYGESNLIDYLTGILNYQVQLWVVYKNGNIQGVGMTKFIQYNQHKTLHIIAFTGEDFHSCASLYYEVEKFAKSNGCIATEMWGRPGWSKILPKEIPGFELAYHVMRKPII